MPLPIFFRFNLNFLFTFVGIWVQAMTLAEAIHVVAEK
jgi:hypothetical protein